jgi:Peptidase_G2, IMC autoproteolytic cleavage domain
VAITLNGTTGITTPAETATTSVTTPLLTSPAATALTIQSAGTTAMTVDTSQNVGIGTSSPSTKLDVNGTILAGKSGSSVGYTGLLAGDATNSGYIAYYNASGTRLGYTGYVGTVNPYINLETDSSSYGVRLAANGGSSAIGVLRTNGQFVVGSSSFTNGTRLLGYDASGTSATLGGFYAASTSYASSVQDIWCDRSSTTAYGFLTTRNASDTNTAHYLRGDGNAYADGTWNNNGADYAEYFESATGTAIPVGTTVVLDGNKVRPATDQDAVSLIMGVVRPKEPSIASMVVGNTAWNKWQGMFLTDDFGRYILEAHEVIEWDEVNDAGETEHRSYESHIVPSGVVVPEHAIRKSVDEKGNAFTHYKINPDYDPSHEYVSREDRPEWLIIGLIGQVPVLTSQPIGDRWIKMRDVSASVTEYMVR